MKTRKILSFTIVLAFAMQLPIFAFSGSAYVPVWIEPGDSGVNRDNYFSFQHDMITKGKMTTYCALGSDGTVTATPIMLASNGDLYSLDDELNKTLISRNVENVYGNFYLKNGKLFNTATKKLILSDVWQVTGGFAAETRSDRQYYIRAGKLINYSDGGYIFADDGKIRAVKLTGLPETVFGKLNIYGSILFRRTSGEYNVYILRPNGQLMYMICEKGSGDESKVLYDVASKGERTKMNPEFYHAALGYSIPLDFPVESPIAQTFRFDSINKSDKLLESRIVLDRKGNLFRLDINTLDKTLIATGVSATFGSFYIKNDSAYSTQTKKVFLTKVDKVISEYMIKTTNGDYYFIAPGGIKQMYDEGARIYYAYFGTPKAIKLLGIKKKIIREVVDINDNEVLIASDSTYYVRAPSGLIYTDKSGIEYYIDGDGNFTKMPDVIYGD